MDGKTSVKHFSMIRSFHLSDLFTLGNGFLGVAAIFQAMSFFRTSEVKHLWTAAIFICVALILDILDGYVARKKDTTTAMGREMDSLADLISFGVAPAAVAFSIGLNAFLDQIILLYFAVCGLSRLARFNVTAESLSDPRGKVRYFEGTPIPTSIIPLGIVLLAYKPGWLFPIELFGLSFHLLTLVFFISGSLMISKTVRIPKP